MDQSLQALAEAVDETITTLQQQVHDANAQATEFGAANDQLKSTNQDLLARLGAPLPFAIIDLRNLELRPVWTGAKEQLPPLRWYQPGATGNTGGTGSTHGTYTKTNRPDGWVEWGIAPKHKPGDHWDTDYFYLNAPQGSVQDRARAFIETGTFMLPAAADRANLEGIEFNEEDRNRRGSLRVNFGVQFNVDKNQLGVYDVLAPGWKYRPEIPLGSLFQPGVPVVTAMLGTFDPVAKTRTVVASWMNGTRYAIDHTQATPPNDWFDAQMHQIAFQVDARGQDKPFTVLTRDIGVLVL